MNYSSLLLITLCSFALLACGDEPSSTKAAPTAPAAYAKGAKIFASYCVSCHDTNGQGKAMMFGKKKMAPSLIGSVRVSDKEQLVRILLQGIAGDIDGKSYAMRMSSYQHEKDEWILDVANYVRNAWGNKAEDITATDITNIRKATKDRQNPWTQSELEKLKK